MASNRRVVQARSGGEQPVSSGIHRAAKRIGLEPADPPANDLDRLDEELDTLRNLAVVAGQIFEHHGEVSNDPTAILREAMRCAGDDFALFADERSLGEGSASNMAFHRAKLRCQLALALFEYRQEFGFTETAAGGES